MSQAEREVVHVYYGDPVRWDHDRLERIGAAMAAALSMSSLSPHSIDGLQADFQLPTVTQAHAALLAALATGVAAEYRGTGRGPTRAALDEAERVGREAYRAMHVEDL